MFPFCIFSNLNVKVKVDPSYALLVKLIFPSNLLTILSDITRPNPIPFLLSDKSSSRNPKSLKSFS